LPLVSSSSLQVIDEIKILLELAPELTAEFAHLIPDAALRQRLLTPLPKRPPIIARPDYTALAQNMKTRGLDPATIQMGVARLHQEWLETWYNYCQQYSLTRQQAALLLRIAHPTAASDAQNQQAALPQPEQPQQPTRPVQAAQTAPIAPSVQPAQPAQTTRPVQPPQPIQPAGIDADRLAKKPRQSTPQTNPAGGDMVGSSRPAHPHLRVSTGPQPVVSQVNGINGYHTQAPVNAHYRQQYRQPAPVPAYYQPASQPAALQYSQPIDIAPSPTNALMTIPADATASFLAQFLQMFQPSVFAGYAGVIVANTIKSYGVTLEMLLDGSWTAEDWAAMIQEMEADRCASDASSCSGLTPSQYTEEGRGRADHSFRTDAAAQDGLLPVDVGQAARDDGQAGGGGDLGHCRSGGMYC
jgi:hypothetical protein